MTGPSPSASPVGMDAAELARADALDSALLDRIAAYDDAAELDQIAAYDDAALLDRITADIPQLDGDQDAETPGLGPA